MNASGIKDSSTKAPRYLHLQIPATPLARIRESISVVVKSGWIRSALCCACFSNMRARTTFEALSKRAVGYSALTTERKPKK